MDKLTSKEVVGLLAHLGSVMAGQRDALVELDGKVGDSDLGLTMSKGFAAAAAALQTAPAGEGPGKLLARAGMALAKAAPSTMGTLMATGFMRGGKAVEGAEALGTPELVKFWEAFLNGVMERGKAKPGEKTVVDALVPVVASMRAAQGSGDALGLALVRGAQAAAQGVEATREMIAQHGKAACFGEKTRGLPDAGATAAAIVIEAMRDFVAAG
jgi:phosphoenolpyruvate---glycerone phosphotransferase subunit DhaL